MAIGIAMLMLTKDSPLETSALQRELATHWPDARAGFDPTQQSDDVIMLHIGDTQLILAKMPAPIPWSDLEGPCATSILWKNAAQEVKQHRLHWIITVMGELEPLELSTLLTQVTAAALLVCPGAIGVYWGNATLVVPKAMFVDFAREVLPEGPPLHIWVDFRVGKDSPQTSAGFTAGMTALGHMELETEQSPEAPDDLRERFTGLASYLLENGPVINDGDTIGQDENERIRVVYSPSKFGHKDQVMRMVYGETPTAKPWWKFWS